MKQSIKAVISLFLLAVMTMCCFAGCVSDQSEYEYIFDYWCTNWYGYFEITDATGKYAHLKGERSDCIAQSEYTYRNTYALHIYDTKGEWLFEFEGDYTHEEEKQNGAVNLYYLSFNSTYVGETAASEDKLPYNIPVDFITDGEDHGIEKLAVFKGTIGEGEDTLSMELYLRHWGILWEDLKGYTGDVFGGKSYPLCLPANYESYANITRQAEYRESVEEYWCKYWKGWYSVTDATGELTKYETDKADCKAYIMVDPALSNWFSYNYIIDILKPDYDGSTLEKILSLYGAWEKDNDNGVGYIDIKRVAGHSAQGKVAPNDSNEATILADVQTESGDSMKIEIHLSREE